MRGKHPPKTVLARHEPSQTMPVQSLSCVGLLPRLRKLLEDEECVFVGKLAVSSILGPLLNFDCEMMSATKTSAAVVE